MSNRLIYIGVLGFVANVILYFGFGITRPYSILLLGIPFAVCIYYLKKEYKKPKLEKVE